MTNDVVNTKCTYLDGVHVYSLALLACQPQHNLLGCLSLQRLTQCTGKMADKHPAGHCTTVASLSTTVSASPRGVSSLACPLRVALNGVIIAHLLVKDRLGLTTISCLLSVVPPLTCKVQQDDETCKALLPRTEFCVTRHKTNKSIKVDLERTD